MPYNKTDWVPGQAVITTDKLNNLETQYDSVVEDINTPGSPVETALTATIDAQAGPGGTLGNLAPNAATYPQSGWVGNTRPRAVAIGGRTLVGVAGTDSNVYIHEVTGGATGPLWVKRHFVGNIPGEGVTDDHTLPALIAVPGKPLIAMYSGHSVDGVLRWRKSIGNAEVSPLVLGPEKTHDLGQQDTTDYTNCNVYNGNIYVLHRTGYAENIWSLSVSTDWAETFTTTALISAPAQFYCTGVIAGSTFRIASFGHPTIGTDHNAWYCEIDLTTGNVRNSAGTVLGNINGTNLPLAQTSLEQVAAPAASMVVDNIVVSGAANPELFWAEGNPGNIIPTQNYCHAVRVGGTWTVQKSIALVGELDLGSQWGAPNVPNVPPVQGRAYLTRRVGSSYVTERWDTTNNGSTWTQTQIDSTPTSTTEVWPVDLVDATAPFETIGRTSTAYTDYTNWAGTVQPLPITRPITVLPSSDETPPRVGYPSTGLYLPGTSGNYVSTPDAPANSPTVNPIRLECDVALANWANASTQQALLCKEDDTTHRAVWFGVNTDGKLLVSWSTNGSASASVFSASPTGFAANQRMQVRADFWPVFNNSTQYRVLFWARKPGSSAWTFLSTTQVGPATNIFDSTSVLEIGARWAGQTSFAQGIFYSAAMRTIGGTLLTGWRGDTAGTTYRDPSGAVWTVTGTGSYRAGDDVAV